MKLLILFLLLAINISIIVARKKHNPDSERKFGDFKKKHKKKYRDQDEEDKRLDKFEDNLALIEAHNQRKDALFKLAVYEDSDLDIDEFVKIKTGLKFQPEFEKAKKKRAIALPQISPAISEIDWRAKGYVTPVKNQGGCGGCWSFSATGSIEGQWFKKYGVLPNLSEQNLIDCSGQNGGCSGGLMHTAFLDISNSIFGINNQEKYPFKGVNSQCAYDKNNAVATVTDYAQIPSFDEKSLETAVATIGPISVGIWVNSNVSYYANGILPSEACSVTGINHGVLIVGYNNTNTPPYWIVKNSWGSWWGNGGYFHVEKGKNTCQISKYAVYPIV